MVLKEPEPGFYLKNLDFWDGSNFELDWFDYRTKKTPKSKYLRRESNPPVRTGGTTLKPSKSLTRRVFVFNYLIIEPIIEPKYLILKGNEQKILLLHSFWTFIFNIRIGSRLPLTKL